MNYKVTKAVLHNNLFVAGVKDFGKTLVADQLVAAMGGKISLEVEGNFLKMTLGKHTELIPLANVSNLTVVSS
jgi:hypothetical protein